MANNTANTNKFINDQWTLNDDLGIGRVGDEVARLVLEASAPFTVGVTGKWGSGKTSIMRRAYATLGGEPLQQQLAFADATTEDIDNDELKYTQRETELNWLDETKDVAKYTRCVWFSPWQHQNEDNPLIPLLLEIQTQFSLWQITAKGKQKKRQIMLAGTTLIERTIDAALSIAAMRNIKVASGTREAMQKAWKQGENQLTKVSDGQRFHLLFEDAVKAILPSTGNDEKDRTHSRLIIFIDDLDRCEESQIIQLLEAIKLYLHSKHCLFVLGLDETAVLDALSRHWQRGEDINREYLEKLFQARIPVPLPIKSNMVELVKNQLRQEINHQFADVMAEDVEALLEPNPRKVKNFVNGLVAQWRILSGATWVKSEEEARRFVMFFYIQQYHRAIWRLLERQPAALCFLNVVVRGLEINEIPQELGGLQTEQQRLLMEIFRRALSHVLGDKKLTDQELISEASSEKQSEKHGLQKLDDAVEDFINRQDRKRSDEYMVTMLKTYTEQNEPLNLNYLMIASTLQQQP